MNSAQRLNGASVNEAGCVSDSQCSVFADSVVSE